MAFARFAVFNPLMKRLFTRFLILGSSILFGSAAFGQNDPGDIANCYNSNITFAFDPEPVDGAFEPGQVVEVCATFTYVQTGGNWIHGVQIHLPDGWDESTINPAGFTTSCGGGAGTWTWQGSGTTYANNFGIGFYYLGGALNWGQSCPNGTFSICIDVTVDPECGGPGSPLNGELIFPGFSTTGDNNSTGSGSWGGPPATCDGVVIDASVNIPSVTIDCCDAEAGTSPGTLPICNNGPFDLFDELGAPVDPTGYWEDESGNPGPGTGNSFIFDPASSAPGDYTYFVEGSDGCINTSTITMEFIELPQAGLISWCSSNPFTIEDQFAGPGLSFPDPTWSGTWTDPSGTELADGSGPVTPGTNPPGIYIYEYLDGNNCPTTTTVNINIVPGVGDSEPAAQADICTSDDPFTPFDLLAGNPNPSPVASWFYEPQSGGFVSFPGGSDAVIDPANYSGATPAQPLESGTLVYFFADVAAGCFSTDTIIIDVFDPVYTGEFTEVSICISDPPVNLTDLLDGTPDPGLTWEDVTAGTVIPEILNPSDYNADDVLLLSYSGGLAGTSCASLTNLVLTILPDDADAGDFASIEVCETDNFICLTDSLGGNPQLTGSWTSPSGTEQNCIFIPGTSEPGIWTYTVTTSCDSDTQTLEVNVATQADAGTDGTLTICSNETDVPLIDGLGGTLDSGGDWTLGGTPVGPTVDGSTVTDGAVYTYTVGTGSCQDISEVTIDLQEAPYAGQGPAAQVIYCDTDAPVSLISLWTDAPAGGTESWSGPGGFTGTVVDPGTAQSGTYTLTVSSAQCGNDTESVDILIESAPDAGTSTTVTACPNAAANIDLLGALGGTAGGTWTAPPGGPVNGTYTPGDPAGDYVYSTESPSGQCTDDATVTINIATLLDPGTDGAITVCEGDAPFQLFGELGGTPDNSGGWADPSGVLIGLWDYEFAPGTGDPGVYTYLVDDGTCPALSAEVTVTVIPDADAGDNNTVTACESLGTVDLIGFLGGSPNPGGTWSVTNPYFLSGQCGTTQNITYTDDNGTCQDVAFLSLTIECLPNAGGDGTLEFCSNDPCFDLGTGIPGTPDAGGTWTDSAGNVVTENQCPNTLGTGDVFTYTVGGVSCTPDEAEVTVNITPAMTVINVDAVCEASQLTYVVSFEVNNGSGPYEITGTEIVGSETFAGVYTSNPIPVGTNYGFTVEDNSNCADLTVNGTSPNCACPASAALTGGAQTICAGETASLPVNLVGDGPWTLTYDAGGTTVGPITLNAGETIDVTPATTTAYSLISVSDQNCAGSVSGNITVNVDTPPNTGPDVDLFLCEQGGNLTLNTILDPGADTPGTFSGPSGNVSTVPYTPASSGVYTYTPAGNSCPEENAEYDITIYPELTVSNISTACNAAQTEYTVTFDIDGGTGSYTVTGTVDGTIAGNTFTSDPLDPNVNLTYGFTVSDGGTCDEPQVLGDAPNCACPATASFTGGAQTICAGETASLSVNLAGDGPWTLDYDAGGTPAGPINLNAGETIDVTPATTTTYTLTSVSDQNCDGSVSGNITVNVDTPPNAGPDIQESPICGGPGNLELETLLDIGADPDGDFSIGGNVVTAVPLTSASTGIYTYTTEANACPADDATYEITIYDPIEITGLSVECNLAQTEYTVSFEIIGGTGNYTLSGPTTGTLAGNTFTSDLIDGDDSYEVIISDDGPCDTHTVEDANPDCDCAATGSLAGDAAICAGSSTDITVTLIGVPPFSITYENSNDPGNPTTLDNIFNGHTITVSPGSSAVYTLLSISDANCTGTAEDDPVNITVDSPIDAGNENITCDDTGDTYTVTFTATGGTGDLEFTNATGTGPVYTSTPFNSGSGYTITVSDEGTCPDVVLTGDPYTCSCTTEAGVLIDNSFEVCTNETATAASDGNEVLDGNDTYQFALHDGDETDLGNIFLLSDDGTFAYDEALETGVVYYISALAGNENSQGNVDTGDPCLSVSNGLPILFYDLPTATFAGNVTVCEGSDAELIVNFTGQGPWTFDYELDGNIEETGVQSAGNSAVLTVSSPGTYTITNIGDANCAGVSGSEAQVSNFAVPTATLGGNPEVCENSGNGPEVTFTGNGPWTFAYNIDGEEQTPAVTTTQNPYTIAAAESGIYALTSLSDVNCTGTVSGILDVAILPLPVATLTGGGTVCAGDEATFTVQLTGTAPWTVQYSVDGVAQPALTTDVPNFTFESGMSGAYTVTSVTDATCQGLAHNNNAALVVNQLPTGELSTASALVCIGEDLELQFELQGTPPFDVTYTVNADTFQLNGITANHAVMLTPEVAFMAELVFIQDGSTPTCSADQDESIFVQVTELPNAPVLADDTICSGVGPVPIGVTSGPGLSYDWTPTTGLSDPKVPNPTVTLNHTGVSPRVYTYVLTASNENCSASDTVNITVDPGPQARFRFAPDPVTSEDPRIFFNNTSIASETTTYFWDFGGLGTSTSFNPDFRFPEGTAGDYVVTLNAIDQLTGCADVYSANVRVRNQLLVYVPNAFTPDGDGKNDLWGPVTTNIDPDDYKLTVHDRWGNVVFETNDINQKWNGGQMNSGYYQEAGMYIWTIEGREIGARDDFEMRGNVFLLR